jgi:putative redox protein
MEIQMSDDWREVTAEWSGENAFLGSNPAGVTIQMGALDGVPGISPVEMVLLGAAGCTGMDIVSILEKMSQELHNLRIQVRGKRREKHPRIYTEIEIHYRLWGRDLDPTSVQRAIELSEQKYCSVTAMLGASAQVRCSHEIFPVGEKTL